MPAHCTNITQDEIRAAIQTNFYAGSYQPSETSVFIGIYPRFHCLQSEHVTDRYPYIFADLLLLHATWLVWRLIQYSTQGSLISLLKMIPCVLFMNRRTLEVPYITWCVNILGYRITWRPSLSDSTMHLPSSHNCRYLSHTMRCRCWSKPTPSAVHIWSKAEDTEVLLRLRTLQCIH